MNAVFVRNYKLHRTLFFYQKKVYHDRKRHLTWVRTYGVCPVYLVLFFRTVKRQKCTGVPFFCHFCDLDGHGFLT